MVDEAGKSGDEELLRLGGGIEKLTQIKKQLRSPDDTELVFLLVWHKEVVGGGN